jgi:hypothetical protein
MHPGRDAKLGMATWAVVQAKWQKWGKWSLVLALISRGEPH